MTRQLLVACVLFAWSCANIGSAESLDLVSPNGSVRLHFATDDNGRLTYSVFSGGQTRLAPARAGMRLDGTDLGAGVVLGAPVSRRMSETFAIRGNKKTAHNDCIAYAIPVRHRATQREWTLEARVFDHGAAFRYRVLGAGARRVNGEATSWRVPHETTLWFQTDTVSYEGTYETAHAGNVPLERSANGLSAPLHLGLPLTLVFSDRTYGLVTEASLFRYSGLSLRSTGRGRFEAAFEDDAEGWTHAGEILSPWRVLVLAADLTSLVNQDVLAALNEPPDPQLFPEGVNTAWIKTGKALCTWMVFGLKGTRWEHQKWFVDRCAALGCEFLLVDAGWRTRETGWIDDGVWERVAELCEYAAQRNVGILLWHSYPPKDQHGPGLQTVDEREEFLRHCAEAGVKGVKVDFFDGESKRIVEDCEDILRRAAKYQLTVNFHGAYKPTGESRTWPNEIGREAVREQEFVLWDRLELRHYGAVPFTRMAAGHADFLPGYVREEFLKNTTFGFQLAGCVIYSEPFLCWPDHPDAYLERATLSFMRTLPFEWDETRVLPGSEIGAMVVMARRKDAQWYVAALNCREDSAEVEIDLAPLKLPPDAHMTLYRDGEHKATCRIDDRVPLPSDRRLRFTLTSGGGALARVGPPSALLEVK